MIEKHLHIVAFNIPFPPDYGGVIDVFYKIKALHSQGGAIILHCFEYDRTDIEPLRKYCEKIFIYKRKTGLKSALHYIPYIVYSRRTKELLENICKDSYPILFEGIHTCYFLSHHKLKDRIKIYRESNIEHIYYYHLMKAERNIFSKIYFLSEAIKLFFFQKKLQHANLMLVVSQKDREYLKKCFPKVKVDFLPSFHSNNELSIKIGKGDYILYHGNLSVSENIEACNYLIKNVLSKIEFPVIIAGKTPAKSIYKAASDYNNIKIIANPSDYEMDELIRNAHIHVLITFQSTGLKLKLLNTLYKGRFVIVNDMMLAGTGLEETCFIANNKSEIKQHILQLLKKEFTEGDIVLRKQILSQNYDLSVITQKLMESI